jgi:hypothetical protein
VSPQKLEDTVVTKFNNAAIVEYTAAIPEAKAKRLPSILHTFPQTH